MAEEESPGNAEIKIKRSARISAEQAPEEGGYLQSEYNSLTMAGKVVE